MADRFEEAGERFTELVQIMARLRAPDGCPWDREQTVDTIKPYLLEETYEVLDAIDQEDWQALAEELGDLLLQPVFLAEIGREHGFDIADSLNAINQKLVRRHPHVFAQGNAKTAEDVKQRWDEIKDQEKTDRGVAVPRPILEGVPRNLPALVEADKVSKKAAQEGFEWPNVEGVLEKLQEEAAELARAGAANDPAHIEAEIGDLLFTLVNLARFLRIDPEQALRKTTARFRKRFAHVESEITAVGGRLSETPLERMEELWQQAKGLESQSSGY
ncbi:MAG: nucleoside triphosphate pyrophosphohydrolase [Acidobacteriaceae bacterium]|nr:nucleoside triphosphate pyrophosphohydrolase [Acidobacteriaceae bacterium]